MSIEDDKLQILTQQFATKLPQRLQFICNAYLKLVSAWSPECYQELLSALHGLTGAAGTYGFKELSALSARIECLVRDVQNELGLASHQADLDKLLGQLSAYDVSKVFADCIRSEESVRAEVNDHAICCLLQEGDREKILTLMGESGYVLHADGVLPDFTESLESIKPGIVIIDVAILAHLNQQELRDLAEVHLQNAIVIAISRSSAFRSREIAARIRAAKFIAWPISTSQLIDAIQKINTFNQLSHRILVIDDEEDTAHYYAHLLERHGLAAEVMVDVERIDDVLHCASPDLILMDLHMPGCDGQVLAEVIRQQSVYENVPILFLSAEQEHARQLNAMSSGADGFICKNIPHDLLVLAIKNKLRSYDRLCRYLNRDLLTGDYNRDELVRLLNLQLLEIQRVPNPLCVALLTINGYGAIISNYGSVAGDQVMRVLSAELQANLRPRDIVGKLERDSFMVIFPDTGLYEAEAMLDDLKKRYSSITFWLDHRATAASFSFSLIQARKEKSAEEVIDKCLAGMVRKGMKVT